MPPKTLTLLRPSLLASALLLAAPAASAQYRDSPFSYNYLDLDWAQSELDDDHYDFETLSGYGGRLSFDSPEGVRILLAYHETEGDTDAAVNDRSLLRQDFEAGVGFITSPTETTDLVLDIKYLRGEWRRPVDDPAVSRNRTQNGYGIEFGARNLLTDWLELGISAEYRDYFTSEIGGRGRLILMFTPNFGLQGTYTWFESQQYMTAGLRLAI